MGVPENGWFIMGNPTMVPVTPREIDVGDIRPKQMGELGMGQYL